MTPNSVSMFLKCKNFSLLAKITISPFQRCIDYDITYYNQLPMYMKYIMPKTIFLLPFLLPSLQICCTNI